MVWGESMARSSLITLRARLLDGLSAIAANRQPVLLLAALFALTNLALMKLSGLIDPELLITSETPEDRQRHLPTLLLFQTLFIMILVAHGVIWARICLLGAPNALEGGWDSFFRRFSVCLTRLLVAVMLVVAVCIPLLLLAALLTTLLGAFGPFGQSMASAASVTLLALPLGAVASALILSISAEAIDRRLSMLAAMQQTQPAWVRLAVVMLVLAGAYGLMAFGLLRPLTGSLASFPQTVIGHVAFLANYAMGFLIMALAIGALTPLLRDRRRPPSTSQEG